MTKLINTKKGIVLIMEHMTPRESDEFFKKWQTVGKTLASGTGMTWVAMVVADELTVVELQEFLDKDEE